ncbi:hypothetical protein DLAC_03384 [Tieghemostelium lacteum]|uniref:Uncharacterized protein n=1 Tax=Tieghemostelium lacteum TaxID=361077 RepID=A0A152A1X3_TIELA|nr:hypothetical protein DLAC_03384 [Tieghemostelium lacteum]|eukprot:KYR00226.1 hypothetical protein DLAC_03384 [Tieghemostelium lacteum]
MDKFSSIIHYNFYDKDYIYITTKEESIIGYVNSKTKFQSIVVLLLEMAKIHEKYIHYPIPTNNTTITEVLENLLNDIIPLVNYFGRSGVMSKNFRNVLFRTLNIIGDRLGDQKPPVGYKSFIEGNFRYWFSDDPTVEELTSLLKEFKKKESAELNSIEDLQNAISNFVEQFRLMLPQPLETNKNQPYYKFFQGFGDKEFDVSEILDIVQTPQHTITPTKRNSKNNNNDSIDEDEDEDEKEGVKRHIWTEIDTVKVIKGYVIYRDNPYKWALISQNMFKNNLANHQVRSRYRVLIGYHKNLKDLCEKFNIDRAPLEFSRRVHNRYHHFNITYTEDDIAEFNRYAKDHPSEIIEKELDIGEDRCEIDDRYNTSKIRKPLTRSASVRKKPSSNKHKVPLIFNEDSEDEEIEKSGNENNKSKEIEESIATKPQPPKDRDRDKKRKLEVEDVDLSTNDDDKVVIENESSNTTSKSKEKEDKFDDKKESSSEEEKHKPKTKKYKSKKK